jgi:hypothetical protein
MSSNGPWSPPDKKRQDLPRKEFGEPRVVQARNPVEDPGPIHPDLGHQELQVRVKVDPVSEGLGGGVGDAAESHGLVGDVLSGNVGSLAKAPSSHPSA